mgnify:CR=1 FL=1|tara:strand:+ start:2427 stop:3482 length:1056 start_codon:yes stop_codon:yes gene_type:complete
MSITWSNELNLRVLITGGAGFIGGALIRRLLKKTSVTIFNLDKLSYASDLKGINNYLKNNNIKNRYHFIKADLYNRLELDDLISTIDPDIVFHLAAESHVDKSIEGPEGFIKSNILGTFNLLEALRHHWEKVSSKRRENFRFHHVSTDEVYGSLGATDKFNENSQYAPRSPYSASKASSDHLVMAWFHTYGFPGLITNCSNNYGPWQFPEKLIPLAILQAINYKPIPMYGDGKQIRDWLYVEDHIDALLLASSKGLCGQNYCIGGYGEKTNEYVLSKICTTLDELRPRKGSYLNLITSVKDRLGHDRRYAINSSKIKHHLGWEPLIEFDEGLKSTIKWYLQNIDWICGKNV